MTPVAILDADGHPFPGYLIDDAGTVYSTRMQGPKEQFREPRVLRHSSSGSPYRRIVLYRDGKRHHRAIHVLMLSSFVGPRPLGMEGCHNDGDPTNNRLDNLRWDLPKGNCADRAAHGRVPTGEKHSRPCAKITEAQVREIRHSYGSPENRQPGDPSQRALAKHFGISQVEIFRIVHHLAWSHIK